MSGKKKKKKSIEGLLGLYLELETAVNRDDADRTLTKLGVSRKRNRTRQEYISTAQSRPEDKHQVL